MGKKRIHDWAFHIEKQKTSGLSVKAYSEQQGFSDVSFYSNRKRLLLQKSNGVALPLRNRPILTQISSLNQASFVNVGMIEQTSALTVNFIDVTIARYQGKFTPDCIAELFSALQRNAKRAR